MKNSAQNQKLVKISLPSYIAGICFFDAGGKLWRSVKYEEVYLHDYENVPQAITGLGKYFQFYNHERLHQSLGYQTPAAIFQPRAVMQGSI